MGLQTLNADKYRQHYSLVQSNLEHQIEKKRRLPHIFASITSGKRTNRKCLKDGRKNLVGDCANPRSHISDGPIRFFTAQQCTAATCWRQAASAVAFSLNSGQSQLDQSESTSPTAGSSFTFTLTIEAAPLLKKRPLLQQQQQRPGSVPLQQAIVLLPLPVFFCGFCERLGAAASRSRVLSSARASLQLICFWNPWKMTISLRVAVSLQE